MSFEWMTDAQYRAKRVKETQRESRRRKENAFFDQGQTDFTTIVARQAQIEALIPTFTRRQLEDFDARREFDT